MQIFLSDVVSYSHLLSLFVGVCGVVWAGGLFGDLLGDCGDRGIWGVRGLGIGLSSVEISGGLFIQGVLSRVVPRYFFFRWPPKRKTENRVQVVPEPVER